jgi:hypothetical protein
MRNPRSKEVTIGAFMGLSGFLTAYSLVLMIYPFININKTIYPLKYVIPTFIISLIVWIYCFKTAKAIKEKKLKGI